MTPLRMRTIRDRILAVLLITLLFWAPLGCQIQGRARLNEESYPLLYDKNGKLSSISLVQAIVAAINREVEPATVYNALSHKTHLDLTQDEFTRYLAALRPRQEIKIDSIERLSIETEEELRQSLERRTPLLVESIEDSLFFHLRLAETKRSPIYQILAVQINEAGEAYLAADWIRAILRISDFAELYFAAIDSRDEEALAWLLLGGRRDFVEGDPEALAALKAKQIIHYYRDFVTSEARLSTLTTLLPGRAIFSQDYVVNQVSTAKRSMEIREENGALTVFEKIPQELRSVDRNIYLDGERVFNTMYTGKYQLYKSEDVNAKLGPILRIYHDEAEKPRQFKVVYEGMTITVDGEYDRKTKFWHGELLEVSTESPRFSFGPDLRVGLSAYDFFTLYPFAAEWDYTLEAPFLRGRASLTAQFAEDKIVRLVWQYR